MKTIINKPITSNSIELEKSKENGEKISIGKMLILIKGIAIALFILISLNSYSQGVELRYGFTDGTVSKVIPNNEYKYVAGSFVRAFERDEIVGNGIVLDTTGITTSPLPYINGRVRTAISDDNGGWYIGGDFGTVDGISRSQIVHILNDNTVDENFTASFSGGVYSLLLDGDSLYVGGQFTVYNGNTVNRLVKISRTTGLMGDWNFGVDNGNVSQLLLDGDSLIISGYFTSVLNGVSRNYLAKLHKTNEGLSNLNPTIDRQVATVAMDGDSLYLGGIFSNVNGIVRNRLAKIHKTTGEVSQSWNPNANRNVSQVLLHNGSVYASGYFDKIDDQFVDMLAKIDPINGHVDPSLDLNGSVIRGDIKRINSFTIDNDGYIYLTGYFQKLGTNFRAYLAKVTPQGKAVESFDVGLSARGHVIAMQEDKLFIGGDFYAAGGQERIGLARFNKSDGKLNSWYPKTDRNVKHMHFEGDSLYIAGHFNQVNEEGRTGIAKLSTITGALGNWNPIASNIEDFIFEGDSIYLAGSFTTVGTESRSRLAKIHKTTGEVGNWNPNAGSTCYDIELVGDSIIIGGVFTSMSDEPRNRLAKIHKKTGQLSNWNPDVNSSVFTLEIDSDSLFVGGFFTSINGSPRQRLAKISHMTGELSESWIANTNQGVYSMLLDQTGLYVGGRFNRINNVVEDEIVLLDKITAQPNDAFNAYSAGYILDIFKTGDLLYLGGDFSAIGLENKVSSAVIRVENDINIDLNGTSLAVNDTIVFTEQAIMSSSNPLSISIENHSITTDLILTGTPMVEITGPHATDFTIDQSALEGTIVSGATAAFTISFTPTTGGYRLATLRIQNSTSDIESPYSIELKGYGTKLDQTLTFDELDTKVYGDHDFELTAMATSGLAPTYSSSNESVATISGSTITIVGGGDTQITAFQEGSSDYNPATPVIRNLLVNKAEQSIEFDDISDQSYRPAQIALMASATSGLDVSFESSNENVISISQNIANIVGAGTAIITASQGGDHRYMAAQTISDITITKADQSINFELLANVTFGDAPIQLDGESSSGLPLTYESSDASIATIDGEILTILRAGSTTITAVQPGNENYNAATNVDRQLTIEKASQIITFEPLQERALTENSFELEAISSSGLDLEYTSSDPSVATISGNIVTLVNFGNTTITATQLGNENYHPADEIQQSLQVKSNQTISFSTLESKVFGDSDFNLDASSSSGLTVTLTSSDPSIASISGNSLHILKAGTVIITASQNGDENYIAADKVNQSLEIEKAVQNITFESISDVHLAEELIELSANTSSGLTVAFESDNNSVATITDNIVTLHSAGSTTIKAIQNGNHNYLAATPVEQILVVNKLTQEITFNPFENKTFGDSDFEISASSSSELTLNFTSSNLDVATISGNTISIVGAGITTITASQGGNDNYLPATSIYQELTVGKQAQEITFETLDDRTFGNESFELTGSSTSNLTITYSSSNPDVATISGALMEIIGVGTAVITATQDGDENYLAATSVNQTLSVQKADQSILMESLPEEALTTDNSIMLNGSSTSGLAVSYQLEGPATIDGNSLVFNTSGTVVITVSQGGNETYNSANPISHTINVSKASQTISLESLPEEALTTDNSIIIDGSSTSGLAISYHLEGPATFDGNSLVFNNSGNVVITASQDGNQTYNSANPISHTINVSKASQTISFNQLLDVNLEEDAITLEAFASSGLDVSFGIAGPVSLSGSQLKLNDIGDVQVTVSQAGNNIYEPATSITQSFVIFNVLGIENQIDLKVFPNPVVQNLYINTPSTISFELIDLKGKVVMQLRSNEWVDVSQVNSGQYLLKGIYRGQVITKRIIKN